MSRLNGYDHLGEFDRPRDPAPMGLLPRAASSQRRHHALAVTSQLIRCGRCGYVYTNALAELGPSYYLREHDEEVERLQLAVWEEHVARQDALDAEADRRHFAGQVQLELRRLAARHPDPLTAAVLLLSGLTEKQLELAGGMPSKRELAVDAIEESL